MPVAPFLVTLATLIAIAVPAPHIQPTPRPDDGMWTFDNPPLKILKEKYGFEPTPEWLEHVRLSSVRVSTGGSGSFVSPNGLIMTNHHVALELVNKLSSVGKDFVKEGFLARTNAEELPCGKGTDGDASVRVLVGITDVTAKVEEAAADAGDESAAMSARGAAMKEIGEKMSAESGLTVDVETFYGGGKYMAYAYKVYDDIRLVFVPEMKVAYFGGDFDNFVYPRWCLDCAFLRAYENGKPVDTSKHHFKWSKGGAAENELVFVSGNPGDTGRLMPLARVKWERDVFNPWVLDRLRKAERRLVSMSAKSEEARLKHLDDLFGVRNSLKAFEGMQRGLLDPEIMAKLEASEASFREAVKDDEDAMKAFATIEEIVQKEVEGFKAKGTMRREPDPREVAAMKVLARARFKAFGTSTYPDANFTLRLSFGTVTGYEEDTTRVPYKTTMWGLFGRNANFDNKDPFDLPERWLKAKDKLDLNTPYNFVSTCDIIGGNSGSPVINKNAEIVGLIFDGNIESLPGKYLFDEKQNRATAVHSAGIAHALDRIFEATELLAEIGISKK